MRFNKVIIAGNLTRDPEVTYLDSGKTLCKFSIAVNEGQDSVSYFDIVAWEKTAELVGEYLSKGSGCLIEGRLKQDRWKDKDSGDNRSKVNIVAFNVQFLDKRESTSEDLAFE